MAEGEVCLAAQGVTCSEPTPGAFTCSLPVASEQQAADLLEVIGSGGALGAGMRMNNIGVSMPAIRSEYERLIHQFLVEVERRRAAGQSSREIARWVVDERRRIANQMRWRSGTGTRLLFEVRDWREYGIGGRSFANVERRYMGRGVTGEALNEAMIQGASRSNTGISGAAIRGARYLRNGGRVVIVLSLATTAFVLLTAPEGELERLLYEEAGGWIGGAGGAGLAVGACLVFGIATGGWGLLACGIVGGIGGGAVGSYAGNRLYYSLKPQVEVSVLGTGVLDASDLVFSLPPQMCFAQ